MDTLRLLPASGNLGFCPATNLVGIPLGIRQNLAGLFLYMGSPSLSLDHGPIGLFLELVGVPPHHREELGSFIFDLPGVFHCVGEQLLGVGSRLGKQVPLVTGGGDRIPRFLLDALGLSLS